MQTLPPTQRGRSSPRAQGCAQVSASAWPHRGSGTLHVVLPTRAHRMEGGQPAWVLGLADPCLHPGWPNPCHSPSSQGPRDGVGQREPRGKAFRRCWTSNLGGRVSCRLEVLGHPRWCPTSLMDLPWAQMGILDPREGSNGLGGESQSRRASWGGVLPKTPTGLVVVHQG